MTAIQDQVVLVTGSTDGIGKQTAHDHVASVGQLPIDFGDVMLERHYNPMQAYCQSKLAALTSSPSKLLHAKRS